MQGSGFNPGLNPNSWEVTAPQQACESWGWENSPETHTLCSWLEGTREDKTEWRRIKLHSARFSGERPPRTQAWAASLAWADRLVSTEPRNPDGNKLKPLRVLCSLQELVSNIQGRHKNEVPYHFHRSFQIFPVWAGSRPSAPFSFQVLPRITFSAQKQRQHGDGSPVVTQFQSHQLRAA